MLSCCGFTDQSGVLQVSSWTPVVRNFAFLPRPHYSLWIWNRRFHFENASNVLRPHYKPEELKNAIIVRAKFSQGNLVITVTTSFSKSSVLVKVFSVHAETKSGVYKFLRFDERFPKAPFLWRISADGKPKRRDKASFFLNGDTPFSSQGDGPMCRPEIVLPDKNSAEDFQVRSS